MKQRKPCLDHLPVVHIGATCLEPCRKYPLGPLGQSVGPLRQSVGQSEGLCSLKVAQRKVQAAQRCEYGANSDVNSARHDSLLPTFYLAYGRRN